MRVRDIEALVVIGSYGIAMALMAVMAVREIINDRRDRKGRR